MNAQNVLKFNADKKLKIVQFTDVHYITDDARSDGALENIRETLDAENPDFVVFTGDIVYGEPADKGLREVLGLVSERKIPFGITFGNHDDEFGLTREQLFEIAKNIPYNMISTAPDVTGVGNYILPVTSSASDKPAFLLYCFDSNTYSSIEEVKGYGHIHFDQIAWYRKQSLAYTGNNGGIPVPSIAFFHIPLPEYNQAAADERAILTGTRKEKACAPELNSGMFVAMKEMGDIMATFVGHDHDNDYAVWWHGIMLAYGRYTGGNTVYNNLKPNGARVIEITEGEKGFRTWIRLYGGDIIHEIKYPDFFLKDKN
ncbi:MAG: metallophosphoesterase family protein [Tannerella sp.]|nr:metallophosphoesterase family protein [Tannerella sp.]